MTRVSFGRIGLSGLNSLEQFSISAGVRAERAGSYVKEKKENATC